MTTAEVRHLFAYTEWANARVLEAAEKLPPEELLRDVHISYKSILGTLLHMAGAEWRGLERWHGTSPVGPDVSGGMDGQRRSQPAAGARAVAAGPPTTQCVSGRNFGCGLSRELGYRRFTGEAYSLPLGQQMQHVVNHATLHRGQVVGMIRQLGVAPPSTDLLF